MVVPFVMGLALSDVHHSYGIIRNKGDVTFKHDLQDKETTSLAIKTTLASRNVIRFPPDNVNPEI